MCLLIVSKLRSKQSRTAPSLAMRSLSLAVCISRLAAVCMWPFGASRCAVLLSMKTRRAFQIPVSFSGSCADCNTFRELPYSVRYEKRIGPTYNIGLSSSVASSIIQSSVRYLIFCKRDAHFQNGDARTKCPWSLRNAPMISLLCRASFAMQ